MNRYKILDLKVGLISPYLPGVDEGRVEEALRRQDGVEVEAGEAPHQGVVRGDQVVGEVPVKDHPVRAAHPLQTEG